MRKARIAATVVSVLLVGSFGLAGGAGNRSGIRMDPCPDMTESSSTEYRQTPLPFFCTLTEQMDPMPQHEPVVAHQLGEFGVKALAWLIAISTLGLPFGT